VRLGVCVCPPNNSCTVASNSCLRQLGDMCLACGLAGSQQTFVWSLAAGPRGSVSSAVCDTHGVHIAASNLLVLALPPGGVVAYMSRC
jgi:hypothetical protein